MLLKATINTALESESTHSLQKRVDLVYSMDDLHSVQSRGLAMNRFQMLSPSMEREWIAGLKEGRLDVFRAIFELYTPELRRFATATVPFEKAEEIVQDVLFNIWQRRNELEIADGGLTKYLFGSVRKGVLHHLRRERVEEKHSDKAMDVELVGRIGPSVFDSVVNSDIESAFNEALQELTELQRAVITLRWSQGLSFPDIADVLGITPNAAMLHASRIKAILRPILEKFTE